MANTAYQNNVRTITVSGLSVIFDLRTEWSSITRFNNLITINALGTRMRVNSGSGASSFYGVPIDVHTDVPSGTRKRNSNLGSGTFNRGSSYPGSTGNYTQTVAGDATKVTSRSGITAAGGPSWTSSQDIDIPSAGLPSETGRSVSNILPISADVAVTAVAGSNCNFLVANTSALRLQYGETVSYGTNLDQAGSGGSANQSQAKTWNLTGLKPGTTYHYRFVFTNGAGRVYTSGDYTFTTLPAPSTSAPLLKIIGVMS